MLAPFPLLGPGFRGLNTELNESVGFQDPTWALDLQNAVWDSKGRLALRKGWIDQTTSAISGTPDMWVLHEYVRSDGTTSLIAVSSNFKFWVSTDNGASWTEITGSVSTTTVRWKFVNFFDELYASAPGHKWHRYTGAGNLTEIATSPVTNGAIIAAFGRLWSAADASDESRIDYCALADGTDWVGTSAGSIDASNAWTLGMDVIQGIGTFGASFAVFGKRHVLVYVDGAGSELGIDPDNMYIVDTIENTGLADKARDSIVNIGEGDLWYLTNSGIQSLVRAVAEKTNPKVAVSRNVEGLVSSLLTAHVGCEGNVQAIYNPHNKFALFLFPESNRILMFDTAAPMEDGTYRCAEWRDLDVFSLCSRLNGDVLYGMGDGNVAKYAGYRDDGGGANTEYSLVYGSPWIDFGPQGHNRLKILKECALTVYGRDTLTGTLRWAIDNRPLEFSATVTSDYVASGSEYAIGEFGEDEYGDGLRWRTERVALSNEGQVAKVHLTIKSDDVDDLVALREVTVFAKPGRLT